MPLITRDLIMRGQSSAGGWNRAQLKVFGIVWPLRPGWIARSLGCNVTNEQVEQFLALKSDAGKVRKRSHAPKIVGAA